MPVVALAVGGGAVEFAAPEAALVLRAVVVEGEQALHLLSCRPPALEAALGLAPREHPAAVRLPVEVLARVAVAVGIFDVWGRPWRQCRATSSGNEAEKDRHERKTWIGHTEVQDEGVR